MREMIRVLVLGTGEMGSGVARLLLRKSGVDLVGVYGRRAERAGVDLGSVLGLNQKLGIPISNDLQSIITTTHPQVAIQTTCSTLDDAIGEITALVTGGVNVISIAEQMAYPAASARQISEDLQRLATENGVAVVGTGINPGFVLDLLVIVLTAVCSEVTSITATRINDLSPYGPSVLDSQGVGLTPDEFRRGIERATVAGHYGFPESLHMIANALGWPIDRIEESRQPIISQVQRETAHVRVEPGQVAGCLHEAVAYCGEKPVITLTHPQQIRPELEGVVTGDTIRIAGTPDVCVSGSPEIPGGQGTVALAVNMIPRIMQAPPGLHTMADLPVPAAMLADARSFLPTDLIEPSHG